MSLQKRLGKFVNYIPVCPETVIGMVVPIFENSVYAND